MLRVGRIVVILVVLVKQPFPIVGEVWRFGTGR